MSSSGAPERQRYAWNGEKVVAGRADEDRLHAGVAQMLRDGQKSAGMPALFGGSAERMNRSATLPAAPAQRRRGKLRARDLALRRAEIERGAGQMFRRVDLPLLAQNLLRARDPHVVNEAVAEVRKAGPVPCSGNCRQPGAPRTSVEVQAQPAAGIREALPHREAESHPNRDCPQRCRGSALRPQWRGAGRGGSVSEYPPRAS